MKTIYIPVSVEDELPLFSWRGFVFTTRNRQVNSNKLATYLGDEGWLITDSWDGEIVTHWLKPIQITENKFNEIIKSE